MNDVEVVEIARQIDDLNGEIAGLVDRIRKSDHPHAEKIADYFVNDLNIPCPAHMPIEIHRLLASPDCWQRSANDTDLVPVLKKPVVKELYCARVYHGDGAKGRYNWVLWNREHQVTGGWGESRNKVLTHWRKTYGSDFNLLTRIKGVLRPSELAMTIASTRGLVDRD